MPWAARLRGAPLRQPDQRSCGAAVAVAATALHHDATPPPPGPAFDGAVLQAHRHLTAFTDVSGALQWPWPPFWGTPPWALARHLCATTGVRHRVRWVRLRPLLGVRLVREALAAGLPTALYLGSSTLPRHVVLALPAEVSDSTADRWAVYDPAPGRVRHLPVGRWTSGTLTDGSWPAAWCVVVPDLRTGRGVPHTRA